MEFGFSVGFNICRVSVVFICVCVLGVYNLKGILEEENLEFVRVVRG